MIEFGRTLREAREAKGYTVAQVAEITRLASTTICELENEDFRHIAAPIYGRGFVKLYCDAVGLDPKPMVAEFMEIFSGNRDTTIRERVVPAPAPHPVQSEPLEINDIPEPPVASEPPKPVQSSFLDDPPSFTPPPSARIQPTFKPTPAAAIPPTAAVPPVRETLDPFAETPSEPAPSRVRLSRYATPIRIKAGLKFLSPAQWRLAALAAGVLVILWILIVGIRALYRATTGTASEAPVAEVAVAESASVSTEKTAEKPAVKPAAKPATKVTVKVSDPKPATPSEKRTRKPVNIPALYLD